MKRTFLWIFGIILALAASTVRNQAIGLIIVDNPAEIRIVPPPDNPRIPIVPPPWVPDRPVFRYTPLEIRAVHVTASIQDQVAETRIEQEFYNPNNNRLEGTFYLPLPKGAHLRKFTLEVNGKMTEAELLGADKARGIYEEIVRKAKDPALLEYLGRDLVKVRIFPIEPHSTKRVEVAYTELLTRDHGLVAYTLPLNTAKYCAAPIGNLSLKIDLATAASLKTIYSSTHNPEIKRHSPRSALIGLEQSDTRPDQDFELFFSTEEKNLGVNLLTYCKENEDGYFMLFASPGVQESAPQPKDVVFVMDTSGSMAGKKIEQARKALLFCLANLHDADRFQIVRFSTEADPLFRQLAEVSEANRKQATEFVNQMKAVGGTAINDALAAALKIRPADSHRPFLVVFVTDGRPTVGVTAEDEIVRNVTGTDRGLTRIFCFGVGTDVNTHLLDRIAEHSRAVSQYVLPEEDLEVKLSNFFAKISDPILAGLEIDFGGVRTSKLQPGKLPDLFSGQQVMVLGRYQGSGPTKITLRGEIQGQAKEFRFPVEFPEQAAAHDFIPRLWANRRVGFLLDEIRLRGENAELKDEVTALAKQYSIVTPYTSYLVTEDVQPTRGLPAVQPATSDLNSLSLGRRAAPSVAFRVDRLSAESGDAAVAGARYNNALREAANPAQLQTAPVELRQFFARDQWAGGPGNPGASAPSERFFGDRRFRFEGSVWVEAGLPEKASIRRIEFDSSEYWAFILAHPDLKEILALGAEVKFLVEGRVIEIFGKK